MNKTIIMRSTISNNHVAKMLATVVVVALAGLVWHGAMAKTPKKKMGVAIAAKIRTFATPQDAANALVEAADRFDEAALLAILGPGGDTIIHTGEPAADREQAVAFAAQAKENQHVATNRKGAAATRAFLSVGPDDWPFPAPIVKINGKWSFDSKAGVQEILYRRIGRNELDAIAVCRGYVDAQHEFALTKREGYTVNEYAQRIIATPGKKDGLAWKNDDGTWGGPIGENIAKVIERGYTGKEEPYHGYYFKVLKGQGPAAPLGQMDFVVKGVMIGGFALVAVPADYGATGVKSFIVSHDGVVYEKDLGRLSLALVREMERFNPDKTWSPVKDDE